MSVRMEDLPSSLSEDTRRTIAVSLDSFKNFLENPNCLKTQELRLAAINLYRKILDLANWDLAVFRTVVPEAELKKNITINDVFFCIRMMNADDEAHRREVMVEWAEYNFGKPKKEFCDHFVYFFGNPSFSEKLGLMYATLILGEKDAKELAENAGIRNFLRYNPSTLENTRDFFQGKLAAGNLNICIYSTEDHNGTFNNNFNDLWNANLHGLRFIAVEWSNPNELIDRLDKIVKSLDTYSAEGTHFELETGILAGHGDLSGVGWAKNSKDKSPVLDTADFEIFKKLTEISKNIHFKQLFIFACSTKEKQDDSRFTSISEMIQRTGLADRVYASDRDIIGRFAYKEFTHTLIPYFVIGSHTGRMEEVK